MLDYAYIDDLQIHDADNLALTQVTGLGSPPPRQVTFSRARRHGSIDRTRYYDGRVIGLNGEAWGSASKTAIAAFDDLRAVLALGADHVLKFRRTGFGEDEQLTFRVASELAWEIGLDSFVTWGVSIFAADPLIYAVAEKTGSYDPTTASDNVGVTFPLVFPLVFAGEATGTLDVSNEGNYPTPPVLIVRGPVTNPIIDNEATDEHIYTKDLVLAAGDEAIIDVGARIMRVGGVSAYSDVITDAGPLGYWRLEEASSAVALADETDNANDLTWAGTEAGVTFGADGPIKSEASDALSWGTTVTTPYASSSSTDFEFTDAAEHSIEFWMRLDDDGTAAYRNVINAGWTDASSQLQGWAIECEPSTGSIRYERDEDGQNQRTSQAAAVEKDVWHYIVITFDGSTVSIYVDGSLKRTETYHTVKQLQAGSTGITLGASNDDQGSVAKGWSLDELAIYDRTLSPAEVEAHYSAGLSTGSSATERADLIDARLTTWFNLQPGVNNLRLRGDDMVADESLLTVTYHDARI